MPNRSTIDAIHLVRRFIELYRDRRKDLHMVFIDLEKANDRVPHEVASKCLEKKEMLTAYMRAIKNMYKSVRISARTLGGDTNDSSIDIRLHQGAALSSFLFTIIMNELTEGTQDELLWCILFANNIIDLTTS